MVLHQETISITNQCFC